jgi:hypothetical protein|tara:strand:- start:2009 stop:2821 length:813 start_codon:yes stop_codon:yes gene_type:complete
MSIEAEESVLVAGNSEAGEATWNSGLTDYDELVTAKGWSGPGDVLESYVNLEKAVGADKVVLPLADTDLAEWEGWSKLGTPDDAEGYDLSAPEGMEQYDQGLSDWFREAAHSAKMPASMAQAMHDKFVERMGSSYAEQESNYQAQQEAWEGELKQEYGTAFDERVAAARGAIREFGTPELQAALTASGMGSNPEFVKAFAKIGMALGKGPQFKDAEGSGQFGTTPEMAQEQIAQIRANPALYDESHAEHKLLNEKLTKLNQLAYGEEPVR